MKQPIIKSKVKEIPGVEIFLSRKEHDIFSSNLQNKHKINVSKTGKQTLNKWRDNMDNVDNEFILRIPDKGKRFIFVDKIMDKDKANRKI